MSSQHLTLFLAAFLFTGKLYFLLRPLSQKQYNSRHNHLCFVAGNATMFSFSWLDEKSVRGVVGKKAGNSEKQMWNNVRCR